ncbi:MAG TPA: hypothetical protein VEX13_01100 [Chloroflexia bacterium]|nr:hypothetical protein [Chloroflexia bacterium]
MWCGALLASSPGPRPSAPPASPVAAQRFCNSCGQLAGEHDEFCIHCHKRVSGVPHRVPVAAAPRVKRGLPLWFWLAVGVLISAVVVVGIIANAATRDRVASSVSGPDTRYDNKGITAILPGSGWYQFSAGREADYPTETWETRDKAFMFTVATSTGKPPSSGMLRLAAREYASTIGYPSSYSLTEANFHGAPAVRLAAKYDNDPKAFQYIEYVFVANNKLYIVGAGAQNQVWGHGGEDIVIDILASVRIK